MGLDPKLRDVLDFLPCEPCLSRPSPDQEKLCSICHRLNRTVALRCQVSLVDAAEEGPTPEEVEAARLEAQRKQDEFETLRAQQERDEEAMRLLQAERDALLDRHRELEERLARLEAASHGGSLSYVEGPEEEVVEFHRVDLGQGDDLMEFESLGSEPSSPFSQPDAGAWKEVEPYRANWEETDWAEDESWEEKKSVDWDQEPEAWPQPQAAAPRAADVRTWEEEGPDWAEADAEGRAHADTDVDDELDARTRDDLAELEAQLADLEKELAKRKRDDED